MSRYELFEAWLSPDEWATFKKMLLKAFAGDSAIRKASRYKYLHKDLEALDQLSPFQKIQSFGEMINMMVWHDTPEGHSYWRDIYDNRRQPIREL